jgi:hypothetical protein
MPTLLSHAQLGISYPTIIYHCVIYACLYTGSLKHNLDILGRTNTIHQFIARRVCKNLRSLDVVGKADHTNSLPSTYLSVLLVV